MNKLAVKFRGWTVQVDKPNCPAVIILHALKDRYGHEIYTVVIKFADDSYDVEPAGSRAAALRIAEARARKFGYVVIDLAASETPRGN
jgi:hypothetical protein